MESQEAREGRVFRVPRARVLCPHSEFNSAVDLSGNSNITLLKADNNKKEGKT